MRSLNVDSNRIISNIYTPVTLPYNVPTSVFFASADMLLSGTTFTPASSGFTKTAPVNLTLIGAVGNSSYGQNIPFVSVYVQL